MMSAMLSGARFAGPRFGQESHVIRIPEGTVALFTDSDGRNLVSGVAHNHELTLQNETSTGVVNVFA